MKELHHLCLQDLQYERINTTLKPPNLYQEELFYSQVGFGPLINKVKLLGPIRHKNMAFSIYPSVNKILSLIHCQFKNTLELQ